VGEQASCWVSQELALRAPPKLSLTPRRLPAEQHVHHLLSAPGLACAVGLHGGVSGGAFGWVSGDRGCGDAL
jgi:hypothetical protein